jgi:5-methylcytosine-specific restriction endonuclease McrA
MLNKKEMKTAKQKLRSQADQIWFLKAMELYADEFGGVACEICGDRATQIHHFFRKSSHPNLRYCFENGIPICVKCHAKITFQDPKTLEEIIINGRGKKWHKNLLKMANQKLKPSSLNVKYYETILQRLS